MCRCPRRRGRVRALFLLFPSLRFSRPSHHVHRAARPHGNTGCPPPPPRRPLLPPLHPPEPLPQGPRVPHNPPVHQVVLPERPMEKFAGSLARGVCSEDVVEGQDERRRGRQELYQAYRKGVFSRRRVDDIVLIWLLSFFFGFFRKSTSSWTTSSPNLSSMSLPKSIRSPLKVFPSSMALMVPA